MAAALVTVEELGIALQMPGLDANDPYAKMIVDHASNAVRDYAKRPGWVRTLSNPPVTGEEAAPDSAREVATWVAVRAYTNPRNLARRGSGPITESFENGLWALELTPAEKERIDGLTGGASSGGGLWIQPIDGGWPRRGMPIQVPTYHPTQPTGPVTIADEGQFPYNDMPEEPTEGGDVEYVP